MEIKNIIYSTAASMLFILLLLSCKNSTMQVEYSGIDISKNASIVRNKTTKEASLKILNHKRWELYAGTSLENINLAKPIIEGTDEGTFAIDVPTNVHSYFLLKTENATAILSERLLPMEGGYNFRDLGGFRTKDGRYTKWGKIFRSDDLYNLTDADLEYLASIPLVSIVDFRSKEEIEKAPDRSPSSVKNNFQISINPGNLMVLAELMTKKEEEMEQIMMDLNKSLVSTQICQSSYKEFFSYLQSDEDIPLMFHCSAGKDRTGMAGALILHALGVDEETIIKDYLSSNDYLGDKYALMKEENPSMAPLFEVRAKYLQAGLDKIKEDYGSIDEYLTKVLDVDIQKMREKYLY